MGEDNNMFWQDYGKEEIAVMMQALAIIILITVLLWIFLRKKDLKYRMIPLIVITSIMLALELTKQIYNAANGTYDWYVVPLHFCSLFLYFYPFMVFCKGKVKNFGMTMSLVTSVWMFVLFYFNPSPIIGASPTHLFETFSNFHTFVHHHLVVLFLLVSLSLNVYNIDKWSLLHVVIGISVYALIAVPAAHLTGTNYCNLLTSNIPFMESLRQSAGQIVYTIVMWLIGVGGGLLVCGGYIGICALSKKRK